MKKSTNKQKGIKTTNFTLAMFRIYRILIQCMRSNTEMLKSVPIYLEIINDIMAILNNNAMEPFIKWYNDQDFYNGDVIKYIEEYYKNAKDDQDLIKVFYPTPVDSVKKMVERSMLKFDKEKCPKKTKSK